jgi:hypothetical protein
MLAEEFAERFTGLEGIGEGVGFGFAGLRVAAGDGELRSAGFVANG